MRKDAQIRRDTLVRVAAQMFEEEGYEVPLESIAERAGIGRGTLYRNFKDRSALILEVMRLRLAEVMEEVEREKGERDAFIRFLRRIGLLSALHAPGASWMEDDPAFVEQWHEFEKAALERFEIPLRRAKQSGQVRDDLKVEDIGIISQMLRAAAANRPPHMRDILLSRAIDLMISGIGPSTIKY